MTEAQLMFDRNTQRHRGMRVWEYGNMETCELYCNTLRVYNVLSKTMCMHVCMYICMNNTYIVVRGSGPVQ